MLSLELLTLAVSSPWWSTTQESLLSIALNVIGAGYLVTVSCVTRHSAQRQDFHPPNTSSLPLLSLSNPSLSPSPSTSPANMSLARRLVLGQLKARMLARTSPYPNGGVLAAMNLLAQNRGLSTSQRRLLAQPLPDNHHHHNHQHSAPSSSQSSISDINPYKDGPSALDKAVHLFFFTEILRGTSALGLLFGI